MTFCECMIDGTCTDCYQPQSTLYRDRRLPWGINFPFDVLRQKYVCAVDGTHQVKEEFLAKHSSLGP
jgi:hypothetical protein